jgi:ABC-type siderophore export system fused ATPase/permease subunit
MGNILTVSKIFTSLTLFEILRFPLNMFPTVINNVVQAKVAVQRISDFLLAYEVEEIKEVKVATPEPVKVATPEPEPEPVFVSVPDAEPDSGLGV